MSKADELFSGLLLSLSFECSFGERFGGVSADAASVGGYLEWTACSEVGESAREKLFLLHEQRLAIKYM